jgi:dTDP-D-glucose 4,6-dehydratase
MSIGTAHVRFTQADEQRDYADTRYALRRCSIEDLTREYRQGMKDCFDIFARNACKWQNLVADALIEKGIHEIPNAPFGGLTVVNTWNARK